MRVLSSIAIVLAVVACQKAPRVEPVPQSAAGDFSCRMHVGPTQVEGEFSIAGDTVMLQAVCSANRTEVYLDEVPIGGRLQVSQIASVGRP